MTCDMREMELLLLAHDELPLARRLALRVHLWRCPVCRKRYARLALVSVTLAGVARGPGAAPWSPTLNQAGVQARVYSPRIVLLTLTIFAVVLMIYVVSGRQSAHNRPLASTSQTVKTQGCAPDLPSDKCR